MDIAQLGWNWLTLLLGLFAFALLVQLIWYLGFFLKVARYQPHSTANTPPVSIIVCAKNEAANLERFLPAVLEQDYPKFQVVVVNDGSWDATADVLKAFQEKYSHLHVVNVPDYDKPGSSKKVAVMLGIKGAVHDHLLLTDADCKPQSDQWLQNMVQHFTEKQQIVIGYSGYAKEEGFLNKLIRFDAVHVGMQYLSFAMAGLPYMGVGRNLAYTKPLFFEVGGFRRHYHVTSGDDDLFINETARKQNTAVEFRAEAQTLSLPETTWKDWWWQKQRHLSTATHYRIIHKILLTLYPFSLVVWYCTFIVLMMVPDWRWLALGIFMCRMLVQMIIFKGTMRRLGSSDLLWMVPFLEVFFLIFNPLVYGAGLLAKPKRQWK